MIAPFLRSSRYFVSIRLIEHSALDFAHALDTLPPHADTFELAEVVRGASGGG
jgi:hypothetical protein